MNRKNALKVDAKGSFYADKCEEISGYGVYGTESGFCYSTHATRLGAVDTAKTMNSVSKK